MQGAWVQSLTGKLGSNRPSGAAKEKGLIFLREHRKGTLLLNDFPLRSGNGAIAGGITAV